MRERMTQRLAELNAEYAAGQKLLADLKANQANLEETLLRIGGAIEVLEELLAPDESDTHVEPTPLPTGADLVDAPT